MTGPLTLRRIDALEAAAATAARLHLEGTAPAAALLCCGLTLAHADIEVPPSPSDPAGFPAALATYRASLRRCRVASSFPHAETTLLEGELRAAWVDLARSAGRLTGPGEGPRTLLLLAAKLDALDTRQRLDLANRLADATADLPPRTGLSQMVTLLDVFADVVALPGTDD